MSFRNRLTLFFVLIVVVPMVAVAFVLFSLIATSESGKADARLAATNRAAINLYREDYNRANSALGVESQGFCALAAPSTRPQLRVPA